MRFKHSFSTVRELIDQAIHQTARRVPMDAGPASTERNPSEIPPGHSTQSRITHLPGGHPDRSAVNGLTMREMIRQVHVIEPFKKIWRDVVPHPASSHIQPVAYSDHRLTLWVSSPVWANWVRHRHNALITAFAGSKLPYVRHIVVRVAPGGRIHGSSRSPSSRPGTSPRTIELIEKTAQQVPELRESLQRLKQTLKKQQHPKT